MQECNQCESLIPPIYNKCPVCGQELSNAKVIKFRERNSNKKEKEEKITALVENARTDMSEDY